MVLHSLHIIGRSLETIVFKDVRPVLFERRTFFLPVVVYRTTLPTTVPVQQRYFHYFLYVLCIIIFITN